MKIITKQYFVAVVAPEPILSEVRAFKQYMAENYQSVASTKSPAHVTLYMPFWWQEDQEIFLKNLLKSFSAQEQAFDIFFNGFDCFAPRVIFIRVAHNPALQVLQKKLLKSLKETLGLYHAKYFQQKFHPHMTIASRDLTEEKFDEAWQEFKNKEYKAHFKVDKITLLKHNGKIWEVDDYFPLG
ncbi:MAG: 2'-5' RNA ligase family protein [Thermoflexibacter sp.]